MFGTVTTKENAWDASSEKFKISKKIMKLFTKNHFSYLVEIGIDKPAARPLAIKSVLLIDSVVVVLYEPELLSWYSF